MSINAQPASLSTAAKPVRRLLSFGDLLDESVRLYRQQFVTLALVSAVALLPSGLILVWASAAGLTTISPATLGGGGQLTATRAALTPQLQRTLLAAALLSIPTGLFSLLWAAGIVVACDDLVRGHAPSVVGVYGRAVRRVPAILLGSIVFVLAMVMLTLVATILFVVTVFGLVGGVIASIALLFWWLRPAARRPWLKWLIVLTTPYGLPTYVAYRWAMYLAVVILEQRGPISAFSRSAELTTNEWFRVASILTVAPLIVGVLISVVTTLVNVPLGIAAVARGQVGLDPTAAAISSAVAIVLQILFQSLAMIVYTELFHDLRNRREGTDIVERLKVLESSPLPADG